MITRDNAKGGGAIINKTQEWVDGYMNGLRLRESYYQKFNLFEF